MVTVGPGIFTPEDSELERAVIWERHMLDQLATAAAGVVGEEIGRKTPIFGRNLAHCCR